MNELEYWIALNAVDGIGPRKSRLLIENFGTPQKVFEASAKEISGVKGMDERTVKSIKNGFDPDFCSRQIEDAEKYGIKIVTLYDDLYPPLLKEIYDPPPLLYVKGEIFTSDLDAIAVVGTRRTTSVGRSSTEKIVRELSSHGITIVSGMARGIDSIAHGCAIRNGGRTLAVLGCGADQCYPPENKSLMEKITRNGAVISEFPIGMEVNTFHFPRRNRIISGLSRGVLVTEAGEKSGALITTNYALDQGRDVFAVPGPITSLSYLGCNNLLRNGAFLAANGQDVLGPLERYFGQRGKNRAKNHEQPIGLEEDERRIYDLLSFEPTHIDSLSNKCNQSPSQVLSLLLKMELRGIIGQLAGKHFVKA